MPTPTSAPSRMIAPPPEPEVSTNAAAQDTRANMIDTGANASFLSKQALEWVVQRGYNGRY